MQCVPTQRSVIGAFVALDTSMPDSPPAENCMPMLLVATCVA